MTYRKINKSHPSYARLQACREAGQWMCDAVTHNSLRGCTNPDCFKYTGHKHPAWKDFDDLVNTMLKEMGRTA